MSQLFPGVDMDCGHAMKVVGRVISGRGLAQNYISENFEELRTITGQELFLGSLNLILDNPIKFDSALAQSFDSGKRMIWPGWINGIGRVWLYRWKGCPLHVLEILSKDKIRNQLNICEGDQLEVIFPSLYAESLTKIDRLVQKVLWWQRPHWYYLKDWYVYNWIVERVRKIGARQG